MELRERVPEIVPALRDYNPRTFVADLVAGVTVGLVALPLAMAFAISSGLSPQAGLYCAIVAGFLSSLLGGSRTQISGPTGAFVVVVAGIVATLGPSGLFMCTLLAGVILVLLGITGLGTAVKFIPRPVVVGFTNGIAVLIASTQLKDFFGLPIEKTPGEFVPRLEAVLRALPQFDPTTTFLSAASLLVLMLLARFVRRVPGSIVVLLGGTVAAWAFHLTTPTIASRFGGIPRGIPEFALPTWRPEMVGQLLAPAITIAMLGAIESLMSAVVADRMTRQRHNPNVELVAQGVANIVSPLVGGLPSTGAIARTATNIRSGGKTPVAGMIHALTLLAILVFAAPLAGYIPLSVLAALLLMVAVNMGEWHEIPRILRLSPSEIGVWAITFGLTVFADLTVAVQAGMILAALFYISRVTKTTSVSRVTEDYLAQGREHQLGFDQVPDGVAIFRIHGPFLFGSTDKVQEEILDRIDELPPVVVLRLRNMTAIDGTGVQALEDIHGRLAEAGRNLILCGIREQPLAMLEKAGFPQRLGPENVCANVTRAMERARHLTGHDSGVSTGGLS